jgi:hypothetical protein
VPDVKNQPVDLHAWLQEVQDDPAWLIPGWIAADGLTVLAGTPKRAKKTYLAFRIALSVANNGLGAKDPFCPAPGMAGPVIIFEEEGGPSGNKERWTRLLRAIQLSPEQALKDKIYWAHRSGVRLEDPQWVANIITWVNSLKAKLVIFDSLARTHGVDENSTEDMSTVCRHLTLISKQTHAAVMVIHHIAKADPPNLAKLESADVNTLVRGSSALIAAADSIITCWHVAGEPWAQVRAVLAHKEGGESQWRLKWRINNNWAQLYEAQRTDAGLTEQLSYALATKLEHERVYSQKELMGLLQRNSEAFTMLQHNGHLVAEGAGWKFFEYGIL